MDASQFFKNLILGGDTNGLTLWAATGSLMATFWFNLARVPTNGFSILIHSRKVRILFPIFHCSVLVFLEIILSSPLLLFVHPVAPAHLLGKRGPAAVLGGGDEIPATGCPPPSQSAARELRGLLGRLVGVFGS